MKTTIYQQQTYNATEFRFQLGAILKKLDQGKQPILIISRSKPRAWLYPISLPPSGEDIFAKWQQEVFPKYKHVKAKTLISLIRRDRQRK